MLSALLLCASSLTPAAPGIRLHAGTFAIEMEHGPYIGGSTVAIRTRGVSREPLFSVLGPGQIAGSSYEVPVMQTAARATLIAVTADAVALHELQLVPPPAARVPLIAVATYYSGLVLHSPRDFHIIGIVPVEGAAGDVATGRDGDLYVPTTDASALFAIARDPWQVSRIGNVPFGNEVAVDTTDDAVFVSNRDVDGKGALTRVRGNAVERLITGITAEGLALDAARHVIYVGNVNDNTIVEVDTGTLRILRRLPSVPRTFGIALDTVHRRLFVVSNQNAGMAGGGFVATIDLASAKTKIITRSARFPFPLGIAFDARRNALFVTDEDAGVVYALNARTLRFLRAPLKACAVPWRPHIDTVSRRLYVPCARANRVAVFDVDSLQPISGSPFATGRNPLSVATSG